MAKKPKTADEDVENAAEGEAPGGKFGFLKNKIVLIGAVAVLALAGGSAWFFMFKGKSGGDVAAVDAKAGLKKAAFLDMKDMVIGISSSGQADKQSFIKMRVSLELSDAKALPEVQPLLPRIEDTLQVYMRELRASDLEGSAGMFRLKEELLRRVNLAVYPAKVDAILFKELLVQ